MTAGAATDPALPANGKKNITHKIVRGDTLWDLAQKHGTTGNAIPLDRYSLVEWNAAASYITGEKCCFASLEKARIIAGR